MRDWPFAATSGGCSACRRGLADGERCWSVLVEGPDGLPARFDFCEACRDRAPAVSLSRWRTINREPPKLPRAVIDPDVALELLERLVASGDEAERKLAYLVVLLLVRRRVLAFVDAQGGVLTVRRPGRAGRWRVAEHRITPDELVAMDRELGTLVALDAASSERPEAVAAEPSETT